MLKTLAYATLFSTALVGSGAYGADNAAAPKAQPPQAQAQTPQAQAQTPSSVNFVTSQEQTQWRAPKLIGVAVYGSDGKEIGKIDDLLMDHSGATQTAVIGVGGFLGIGKKDVGVPFSAIQWKMESRNAPAASQPPANPAALAPAAGGGQQPPAKETDPAATEASQGYPDKAVLNVTMAELKAAPDFHYAQSPVAESNMKAPAGGGMKKSTP